MNASTKLSMNGKSPMISIAPPFVLRLSKDERRVFQRNPGLLPRPFIAYPCPLDVGSTSSAISITFNSCPPVLALTPSSQVDLGSRTQPFHFARNFFISSMTWGGWPMRSLAIACSSSPQVGLTIQPRFAASPKSSLSFIVFTKASRKILTRSAGIPGEPT